MFNIKENKLNLWCSYAFIIMVLSLKVSADEFIIIGVDDKVQLTEQGLTKVKPTKDYVCLLNIAKSAINPAVNCELTLENSIFGPPVNLSVTPDEKFAIVANSVNWIEKEGIWQAEPDVDLHLIDLTQTPIKVIHTLQVAKQPSGIAISRDGKRIAIAHRHAKSVSLVALADKKLSLLDNLEFPAEISSVAFADNDQSILATQFSAHAVSMITLSNDTLIRGITIPVGLWPYNVKVEPKGRYAVVANTGNKGLPDGNIDTVSIIALKGAMSHVVNTISVGDGPEGLAISPDGKYVAVALLQGSGKPFKDSFFYNERGGLVVYSYQNFQLKEINRFNVGGFPEGVAFSKDSTHLYIGNIVDKNIEIFSLVNEQFFKVDNEIKLPGQPVSMGSSSP
ncbi:MAG: YncE family protein [Thalassotalea sp.]